jgi:histidyl-tRNA synthetase
LNQVIDGLTEEERSKVTFDMTLARGLNYYTGAIIEVVHAEFNSSIAGGGRYDDLTSVFGLNDMSGVGVSFGADRIYDLMVEKDLFPNDLLSGSQLLFLNFGDQEAAYIMKLLPKLRAAGIPCELYPDTAKIKKQFKYADQKGIPFVAAVGTEEMNNETISLKNLATGEQSPVTLDGLIEKLG